MTNFFHYEVLTWPEVSTLPRNTPLLLPLGTGYSHTYLAKVLDYPPQVGLLPPFPFGWEGSGLSVPDILLVAYMNNLLGGLEEDGFTRLFYVIPQMSAGLYPEGFRFPCIFSPQDEGICIQRSTPLLQDQDHEKVVLVPIGHTEQHAFHLPLSTDTIIIDAISQGVVNTAPKKSCKLPVVPYGVSMHRSSFAGTLSAGGRAFEDFWISVVNVLVERGFSMFYFMNGHGGNGSFLTNVVKYCGDKHRRIFCATASLYLTSPEGINAVETHRRSKIGGMGHACELETSFILHLYPDLVHMERVVDETDFITTPSYYMDWVEGGALVANPPWDDDTATGAYGAGSLGTAEHGRIWLNAAIEEKVSHINEIIEQQKRREERRNGGYGLWTKKAKLLGENHEY